MRLTCPECGETMSLESLSNMDVVAHCLGCGCIRDLMMVDGKALVMRDSEPWRRVMVTKPRALEWMRTVEGHWATVKWVDGKLNNTEFSQRCGCNPATVHRWKMDSEFMDAVRGVLAEWKEE